MTLLLKNMVRYILVYDFWDILGLNKKLNLNYNDDEIGLVG